MRMTVSLLILVAPAALAQTSATGSDAATGARPGDEALTCEQIRAELTGLTADPAFKSLLAQQEANAAQVGNGLARNPEAAGQIDPGALAQLSAAAASGDASAVRNAASSVAQTHDGTAAQSSPAGAPPPKPKRRGLFKGIGAAIGAGAAGAFGADRGAVAAQQAQIEAMGKAGRAAQDAQRPVLEAQAAQVAQLSPQLMRGMRLTKLAEARGCMQQQGRSPD